jgi:hypothetical protein
MDQSEVFLKARGFLRRIKAMYTQKFMRPVAEETRRVENPATHVGKALPFDQIMFITLQGLLGALAIFDVGEDTIPLKDVSIFVSERHSALQMQAVFPIRAAETNFVLKIFTCANALEPLAFVPLKIIWVSRGMPTGSSQLLW